MRQNLLETYSRQLKVAEAYVAKNYDGKSMSANTKLTTAVLLDNTNRWMTEALSSPTSRADLGDWKKFCLNLTNIAVPSLIANDLVIVHPMTSYSGSVAYLKYVSRTNKGDIKVNHEFNSVFGLGESSEARTNFTAPVTIETATSAGLILKAAKSGKFEFVAEDKTIGHADVKIVRGGKVLFGKVGSIAGDVTQLSEVDIYTGADDHSVDGKMLADDKVAYYTEEFQMDHVPATAIPTIGPKMEHIALVAEPRRIAVRYDQITAFQAKTDYGFSLDKQIAEQACGELAYEIDTEIVRMLADGAGEAQKELTWSKTLPVGVSKFEHYNGFLEIIEAARAIIYNRTKKFHPNYMVIAADVLPVLRFVNGFTAVRNPKMNGPYKVGELDSLAIYVSPELESGEFFFGLNGNDMMSSAGVYAPYMAIVPTQLLGTPDGGLAQGFSTWYAKALLNENLLVAGKIVD